VTDIDDVELCKAWQMSADPICMPNDDDAECRWNYVHRKIANKCPRCLLEDWTRAHESILFLVYVNFTLRVYSQRL